MKNRGNWSTSISLLIVLAACVAIAWRLSPSATPQAQAHELLPPPSSAPARDRDVHPDALARSPLETMLDQDSKQPASSNDGGVATSNIHYRLEKPDRTYALAPELDMISDLSTSDDSKSLWAVTAEKGSVFRLSIADGGVEQTVEFAARGDCEGVSAHEGKVVVARTDGELFVINLEDSKTTTVATHLGTTCSLQGVAWDPNRKSLLLICKFAMPKIPHARKSFAIYAMTLEHKLIKEPVIVVPRQAIDDYLGTHPGQPRLRSEMGEEFTPTAIGVHPTTHQIFLVSGRGTMLVVLAPNGTLVRVDALDPVTHPHPKGITFDSEGTMYISNAARGDHALIQAYRQVR